LLTKTKVWVRKSILLARICLKTTAKVHLATIKLTKLAKSLIRCNEKLL